MINKEFLDSLYEAKWGLQIAIANAETKLSQVDTTSGAYTPYNAKLDGLRRQKDELELIIGNYLKLHSNG